MTWKAVGAVAALVLTTPAISFADRPSASPLPVRIFNNVGISQDDLLIAAREAETILGLAGITVSLMECWYRDRESPRASEPCRQPLEHRSLTLRLPPTGAVPETRMLSMGYALVNLPDRAPFLATVYSDLVTSVARNAKVDPRVLLGRAIAHEIGHLLLNTNRHGDGGLMREKWTQVELQKNDPGDWTFRGQETSIMQAAIATRLSEAAR